MTHLTPDELVDAVEGVGAFSHANPGEGGERQAHLADCAECRRELAGLSTVLGDVTQLSVPEPSPLFWPHFSERVRTALDADTAPGNSWPSRLRWQLLLPPGAVAMIILALLIAVPKHDPEAGKSLALDAPEAPAPPAPDAPYALHAPDSWSTVADLMGGLDVETASAAGVIGPGFADQAVLQLTADEQLELTRLLTAELTRAKS